MHANLIVHRDAFRIHLNPELTQVAPGGSVYDVLFRNGLFKHNGEGLLVRTSAFVVLYNGEPLLQKNWNTLVAQEDLIQIIVLPRGGGNSNIGAILGAILTAVLAYFTFGLSLVASVAVGVVAYAALSMIGMQQPTPSTSLGRDKQSPTYSLSKKTNDARLLEAIPRVYGRMRTYPDLASQSYSEFKGNAQVLYQLFCVSLGNVDIEQVLIEDNDIESFADATVQIVKPGQAVTLFPDNVVTSDAVSNMQMLGPDEEDFLVLGPFISAPSGSRANFIGIDIVLSQGLGKINDKGTVLNHSVAFTFQYREVDDNGLSIGSWNTLIQETLTYATREAQMLSFKIAVPLGRYEIKGERTSNKAADTRTFDSLSWAGMRAYLESTFVYPDVTLVAIAMRASNVLNSQTARSISVISKSLLPKWDPIAGYTQPIFTNNPAWIAMDALRNVNYGRKLETSRFNVQELYRLAQVFDDRGDTFNGVFDTTGQLWEALVKILRVGRTTPIPYAGVIDFVRDEPKTVPNAMFSPSNMLAGSFKTDYSFFTHETPDHVVMEYIDPVKWTVATVKCTLPGEPAERPKTVELFGCTNRDQAWREGMALVAANRDRRRSITFSTNSSGLIPYYNSLARISHDVPQWGYWGRVYSLNPANGKLRTSEPVVFDGSPQHVIAFRKRNGSEDGPYPIVPDPSLPEGEFGCIVVGTSGERAAIYISDGVREDFTYYQCGPTEREGLLVLIQSAKPNEDGSINITAINYADSVHAAENGGVVPPPPPASNLPVTPSAPIVDWVQVVYTTTVGEQNIIASAARGAIYYEFRASQNPASENAWLNLETSDEPRLVSHLAPGQWRVQVRGVGRVVGPWATWDGVIEATSLPTASLDMFTAVSKLFAVGLNWAYNAESLSIVERVQVWVGVTNILGNATKLVDLPYPANAYDHTNLAAGQSFFYWARCIDTADREGPWFNGGVPLQAGASTDAVKILDFLVGKITKTQLAQNLLEPIEVVEEIAESLAAIDDQIASINAQLAEVAGAPEHDSANAYGDGALVKSAGKLYRAIQAVPAGTLVTNTAYWELIGNYDSVGEALSAMATRLNNQETRITNTEDAVEVVAEDSSLLAAQLRGTYEGTDLAQVSQGLVFSERQARITADEANATLTLGVRTDLTALTGPGGVVTGHGTAITTLTSNVQNLGGEIVAVSERVDVVEAGVLTTRGNLIPNGGFEDNKTGWIGGSLTTFAVTDTHLGRIARSTTHAATGSIFSPKGLASPGLWFSMSGDAEVASTTGTITFGLRFYDAGDVELGQEIGVPVPMNNKHFDESLQSRRTYSREGLAPAGTTHVRAVCYWTGLQAGAVLGFRQIKVELGRLPVTPYIVGAADAGTRALITNEASVRAQADQAEAQQRSLLAVTVGNNSSAVQTLQTTTADINGDLAAMYTIKTQLTVGGVPYMAGLGVGVENNQGIITSQILLAADRVAVLNTENGVTTSPFIIENGQVIINQAIIGQLSANKINVGMGGNKLANSALLTTSGWNSYDASAGALGVAFGKNQPGPEWVPTGGNTLTIYQPNANYADYAHSDSYPCIYFTDIPVEGGKRLEISAYIGSHRCRCYVSVEFYSVSQTGAYTYRVPLEYLGDNLNAGVKGGGRTLSDYKRCFVFATPTVDTTIARLTFVKYPTFAGNPDSWLMATAPQITAANPGQTALSQYSQTGQGVVITPEGISTPSLSALSSVIGLLRSAPSGQRMEVGEDGAGGHSVRAYDFNGVMRARLGTWQ